MINNNNDVLEIENEVQEEVANEDFRIFKPIESDKPWWQVYRVISDKHPKQKKIFYDTHQFKIASCGSGFGKTVLAQELTIQGSLLTTKKEGLSWIVAPTLDTVKDTYWSDMLNRLRVIERYNQKKLNNKEFKLIIDFDERGKKIWVRNRGKGITQICLKSAESDKSLIGKSVNVIMVIDEMWKIKHSIWSQHLQPRVMRGNCSVFIISTPNGHDNFWKMWLKGSSAEGGILFNSKWRSWQCATYDNPIYPKEYCEQFKKDMTTWEYSQQIEGSFEEPQGKIYLNFKEADNLKEKIEPNLELPLYMTWDFNVAPMTTSLANIISGNKDYQEIAQKKKNILETLRYERDNIELRKQLDEITRQLIMIDTKEQEKVLCFFKTFYVMDTDTEKQCILIKKYLHEKGFTGKIYMHGDATGGARSTQSDRTNWRIIKSEFNYEWECHYEFGKTNPEPLDRIKAVNKQLKNADNEIGIYIDKRYCKPLITDFQRVTRKKGSNEVDKGKLEIQGLNHCVEGAGYLIYRLFGRKRSSKFIGVFTEDDFKNNYNIEALV